MKTKFLFALTALLTFIGFALTQPALASGAKVDVGETNFNFGYVHAGGVVSHSYMLKSAGSDSLKILKVQPACGCTKAPLKKEVVAIGDSAGVELVFTLSTASRGRVSKSAMVYTNDSTNASFQLQFAADSYTSPDSITPLTLSTGEIKFFGGKNEREAKVIVTNVSQAALKMHMVSTSPEYFRAEVPDAAVQPGKSKEIKVKLGGMLTVDEFKQSFTFQLDDQAGTRYTIPVELVKPGQASTVQPVSGH